MDIKNVKRKPRAEKLIPINLRIKKSVSLWLKKNDLSPTKIFNAAVEELMEKNK